MQEIAPGVYLLNPEGRPVYPYSNSVWIDDGLSLLIDVGAGARVYQRALASRPVDIVLLTHSHFDHLHCQAMFAGAALWAAAEEAAVYQDETAYLKFHGYEYWPQMMAIPRPPYGEVNPVGDDVPVNPGYRYFKLDGLLEDGAVFSTGRYTVRALHLPGHTIGHYGFLIEELNLLVSGDMDFRRSGPGYYNATSDIAALLRSLARMKELDLNSAIPAHRGVQRGEMAAKLEAFTRPLLERIAWLEEYLVIPRRVEELYDLRLMFERPAHIYEDFWNRMTMLHHLEHLRAAGRAREIEPGVLQRV